MRKAYTSYDIIASKNMSDTSHTFSSTNQKFPLQIMLKKNLCKIYRQLLVVFFFWGGGRGILLTSAVMVFQGLRAILHCPFPRLWSRGTIWVESSNYEASKADCTHDTIPLQHLLGISFIYLYGCFFLKRARVIFISLEQSLIKGQYFNITWKGQLLKKK